MESQRPRAVLAAVQLPGVDDEEFESSLVELERLVKTLGYEVVARLTQARQSFSSAAVLGEGKLQELAELTGGTGKTASTPPRTKDKARLRREREQAPLDEPEPEPEPESDSKEQEPSQKIELVAIDHEISPSQIRNLERATGTSVLDRSGVIIEIFHRHAKSREARLQVEIARLAYTAPRLREAPSGKERQAGRGAGEAAIELDRRRIRDRIAELREQLAAVAREQSVRRSQRSQARRVALVGYTNAGKSSLMRALTSSDVHVEDKLFATLDTTVRALQPESAPRILVSDTVGFIKKLPHDLVASFKSTLDEACEASLLLHVVDGADANFMAQLEVTSQVLQEIGAGGVPRVLVMNKIDKLLPAQLEELRELHPESWFVSAHDQASVLELREKLVGFFEAGYEEAEFLVPYDRQRLVSAMHESTRVLEEKYEEQGVLMRLRSDAETLGRLRAELGSRA